MREETTSGGTAERSDGEGESLQDSSAGVTPLTSAEDPPPYGAQHRQDALWKGGNEALPHRWSQFELGGNAAYQDDDLLMASWNRPLPGVRLDEPGDIVVSGCEWHISPLGRSYFVNHNTRTTSWSKPMPERPAGSLTPERVIEGHFKCIWSLACVGNNNNVMSASDDGSIRQWTRDGEPVGELWHIDGGEVGSMAVSPDGTMVVGGSGGRLWLWNVKEGRIVGNPWEGHTATVKCLDWDPSGRVIASGSQDGTIRRWNPGTGQQIGLPIQTGHGEVVCAIKFAPQGDKLASGGWDDMIRVWSKDGGLLIEIKGHDNWINSLCWSKDGVHIFSASEDCTIRKWQSIDGKEVFVLRGHTRLVTSICISPDERHLVSSSLDCSVRVWNLKTNQQVGNPLLHDSELRALAISSDGQYAVSAGLDTKIYVWSLKAALICSDRPDGKLKGNVFDVSPLSKQQVTTNGFARYGDGFWGNDTNRTPDHSATLTRPSPYRLRSLFDILRFNPRPVTRPTATQSRRTSAPITQFLTTTSSAIKARLRILSNWWIHTGYVSSPVVDVPLTRGDQRNATAGAPKGNGGFRRDEDFDPPPPSETRNTDSQQPSAVAQTNTGEHGSGRFCFCV